VNGYKIQGVTQIKLKQIEELKHRISLNNMQQFSFHLPENLVPLHNKDQLINDV
jgi:hypothetical protein